jgi:hypothetical protein
MWHPAGFVGLAERLLCVCLCITLPNACKVHPQSVIIETQCW